MIKSVVFYFFTFLFITAGVPPAGLVFAVEAQVEDLSDRAYFDRALERIEQAKESIDLSLYEFHVDPARPNHPGTRLADALLRANARGVACRVVLNRDFNFAGGPGEESVFTQNDEAYQYLRKAGLKEVYFADPARRVHDKLLVVDGRWVIEGSHNWSLSALRLNRESSILVDSPEYARGKRERIQALAVVDPSDALLKAHVRVPNAFLKDPRFLRRFVHDSDFRAMKLYLWLLYEAGRLATGELEVDLERLGNWADLPPDWDRSKARRQIIKTLKKKLAKRYRLIEAEIPHGKSARIRLLPLESGERGYVRCPEDFFEYGVIHELSHAALTAYLTGLYLYETSPIRPWWQVPQTGWAALFGISPDVVQVGTSELRRLNILEVIYFGFDQKPFYKDRPVNQYRLNELISPAEEAAKWKALEAHSIKESFLEARRYARILDEPRDPRVVARLLVLLENYPADWVREAMGRMQRIRTDNPRKHVQYVEGILEGFALDRERG